MDNSSSNPVFSSERFSQAANQGQGGVMTVNGAVNKTLILLAITIICAAISWTKVASDEISPIAFTAGGGIIGLICVIATFWFKPTLAPYTAPIYCVAEGMFLGAISVLYQHMYKQDDLVLNAVTLTFGILLVMLLAYKSGLIRATEKLQRMVAIGFGGILMLYLASFISSMFGHPFTFLDGGPIGIGICVFVVGLCAFSLVIDFDVIEQGAAQGAPKSMEWYGAFGLMVTLVIMYVHILRLLAMLQSSDD